ncbi:MAG: RNA polymerase sigma factor [Gemmatimonadota bacterium]
MTLPFPALMPFPGVGKVRMEPHPPGHRATDLPRVVSDLLGPSTTAQDDRAWQNFLEEFNRLLLHVARSLGGDRDAAMDRYTHVLEELRKDDFRRLRKFASDGRGKFSTWLTVVARRICLDHYRSRYGRVSQASDSSQLDARRRLADLVAVNLDPDQLGNPGSGNPIAHLQTEEVRAALDVATRDLEPEERLLLVLRFADDRSAREIAEFVGLPSPFHVYRRLNGILARLRLRLAELGIEEPPV